MYGRLVEVDGFDPSKRDSIVQTIREQVIPRLQEMDGFAGFISLVDADTSRSRAVVLWETREAADEAEQTMKARREEIVSQAGGTVRSTDLYEAPIVEMRAGVHA